MGRTAIAKLHSLLSRGLCAGFILPLGILLTLLLAGGQIAAQDPFNPAPQRPPGPRIDGRVIDEEGNAAVNVTILAEIHDMRIRRAIAYERTTTNIAGEFSIDLSKHTELPRLGVQINTLSPRYQEVIKIIDFTPAELPQWMDLVVKPGAVARGVVRDAEGNPLQGVGVSATRVREVTTNDRGEFEIFGLPTGGEVSLLFSKGGYAQTRVPITADGPSIVDDLTVTLQSAARLAGRAIDPAGRPIARGVVFLSLDKGYIRDRLDREGRFEFAAVPANMEGTQISLLTDEYPRLARPLTVDESESREVILRAEWPRALAGVVRLPDGSPVAGIPLIIGDGVSERPLTFTSGERGVFHSGPLEKSGELIVSVVPPLPTGRRGLGELEFKAETSANVWSGEVNPWPDDVTSVFEARIEGNRLTMTRTDAGGGGLPGTIQYEGEIDTNRQTMKGTLKVELTGATGTFQARAYSPNGTLRGVWDLREELGPGKHLLAPSQHRVSLPPFPGTTVHDLALDRPGHVAGRVVDASGAPVRAGRVLLQTWNFTRIISREGAIGLDGAFRVEGLPEGLLEFAVLDSSDYLLDSGIFLRRNLDGVEIVIGGETADPMDEKK